MAESKRDWLEKVYGADSPAEIAVHYDEWARTYERDLLGWGYVYPVLTSGLVSRYITNLDAPILDAGAGTGLVGQGLSLVGYTNLSAIDISDGMLEEARRKHLYRYTQRMTLGEELDFDDDRFVCVVSMGTMTLGHASAKCFDELMRITSSGGYCIFSISDPVYHKHGFKARSDSLVGEGLMEEVFVTEPFDPAPYSPERLFCRIYVYRVLPNSCALST